VGVECHTVLLTLPACLVFPDPLQELEAQLSAAADEVEWLQGQLAAQAAELRFMQTDIGEVYDKRAAETQVSAGQVVRGASKLYGDIGTRSCSFVYPAASKECVPQPLLGMGVLPSHLPTVCVPPAGV
jgi:hypothetical protein